MIVMGTAFTLLIVQSMYSYLNLLAGILLEQVVLSLHRRRLPQAAPRVS